MHTFLGHEIVYRYWSSNFQSYFTLVRHGAALIWYRTNHKGDTYATIR